MPDMAAYLSSGGGAPVGMAAQRAARAWKRITDKPTIVTFRNAAGVLQATQTVRVEYDNGASRTTSAAGQAAMRGLTVFGVRDHPTIADTNVGEGYRFVATGDQYTCIDIIVTIGEVQAIFEATG